MSLDMYSKNSTFISLTENIDNDAKKIDAAKKMLDNIYNIHNKVNELWEKNEQLKDIKDFISKSKKIIRVSSDIHGDTNCLNFNLNNIITLKKDSFLVVDPTNGKKIFEGSIDDIKSDLKKGAESEIRKALKSKKNKAVGDNSIKEDAEEENNIVLLHDFDIDENFNYEKEINVITGDHIDRGPHSSEVLCMELLVKRKLEEKKLKNGNGENKIVNGDEDKKILESEDNLVLTIGDHETGYLGKNDYNGPDKNESVANSLAKKMIIDRQFVPAYLHKLENGNITSHFHVMFLVPHVFQVFRQIDELEKLCDLGKNIDSENFFDTHQDNDFVQTLNYYKENDKRGKIILKSLINTYKKLRNDNKYSEFLNKIFSSENIGKVRKIIGEHEGDFYKDWNDCVNAGYDLYRKVKEEFNLSTEDFFKLRNFAMDVLFRPIASDAETKKELAETKKKLTEEGVADLNPNDLLVCFGDYFSDSHKGFYAGNNPLLGDQSFKIKSCLVSLYIIQNDEDSQGLAPNIYWERRLDGKEKGEWNIEKIGKVESNKLIFPSVSQIIGHDRISDHKIQFYDKSIINNDTASSIGYCGVSALANRTPCCPNEIIYDPKNPKMAYNVTFKVSGLSINICNSSQKYEKKSASKK